MKRTRPVSLIVILFVAFGGLAATLWAGWSPALGLDLQGGASVVLQPDRKVANDVLEQSIEIIRSRVDALGVAEPDISRLGDTIVVQLPGVKDQERALSIVGQTAELRFRPVLAELPPEDPTLAPTTTTAPGDDPAASDESTTTTTAAASPTTTQLLTETTVPAGTSPREEDQPESEVILPEYDKSGEVAKRFQLGPALLTGRAVDTASARAPQGIGGEWQVDVEFTGSGSTEFNNVAALCFDGTPQCPSRRLAIVLDGVVKSAPAIQARDFAGRAQITGNFSESEAKDLALVLRFGSLPVQLEPQAVRTVSATLGHDSLRAGIIAGIGGLILVLLYIIFYYRALGLVVVLGLTVWASLEWVIISALGENYGLALSLAGAVGIIVSVGITSDSYIVYFERLKDEIRSGKTIRSAVDRGFAHAFRTIRTADISSLIGAGLLYWLTVGPVRGFALFLGLSTLLDLVVAYFFTRPVVALLTRNSFFTEAKHVGIARGLAAAPTGSVS
ncbi:MAG: protein translocase subunit SecD [Acidimicrobiales bacterium]